MLVIDKCNFLVFLITAIMIGSPIKGGLQGYSVAGAKGCAGTNDNLFVCMSTSVLCLYEYVCEYVRVFVGVGLCVHACLFANMSVWV